jgi:hypothetical protein
MPEVADLLWLRFVSKHWGGGSIVPDSVLEMSMVRRMSRLTFKRAAMHDLAIASRAVSAFELLGSDDMLKQSGPYGSRSSVTSVAASVADDDDAAAVPVTSIELDQQLGMASAAVEDAEFLMESSDSEGVDSESVDGLEGQGNEENDTHLAGVVEAEEGEGEEEDGEDGFVRPLRACSYSTVGGSGGKRTMPIGTASRVVPEVQELDGSDLGDPRSDGLLPGSVAQ